MGAQGTFDFGEEIGAATTVKLVGNFLIISAGGALIEGLSLVEKLGFDPVATIDMLTSTLFPAPIYKSYGRMIAEHRTPPGGSPIPEKDLSLFKATAQTVEAPTPMSSLLLELRRAQT
jgi:3-hydroxyisobutyrate dehydrogenase-like beta-hydroxyacid dehydrogenase